MFNEVLEPLWNGLFWFLQLWRNLYPHNPERHDLQLQLAEALVHISVNHLELIPDVLQRDSGFPQLNG